MKAKDFLDAIRQHWSIENRSHWVLDVAFRADDSCLRAENAAENFVVLKHMALNFLHNVKGSKVGIKIRRFEAACNDRFLLNILASCPNSMRLPWGSSRSAKSCRSAPSTYHAHQAQRIHPELRSEREKREPRLCDEIRRVWEKSFDGVYGDRKIWHQLNHEGIEVARSIVERLMQNIGLQGADTWPSL